MPPKLPAVPVLMVATMLVAASCGLFKPDCGEHDPADGEEVNTRLKVLGYSEFDSGWSRGRDIHTSDERWQEQTSEWGTDGGLDPDFSTEAVFEKNWADGGCSDPFTYEAWRWGEVLRVYAERGDPGGCDAHFPQIDLVLVKLGGATDLGWCN